MDMTNSQNLQFFGSRNKPYPLELNAYHRYLIPNYENEVDSTDLKLWLVGDNEHIIPCEFGFNSDKNRLMRISFICDQWLQGAFEIRKSNGEPVFYSNCVKFIDSSYDDGRKYVRVATKCYFNRLGFQFDNSSYDWFITNLPAHDLGLYGIDSEYTTEDTGTQRTPEIQDNPIVEVSTLTFVGEGDCNVLNFILFSVLNNEFYLNGTKRTIREKPEFDDFMITGKMKFAFNKEPNGRYITVDEKQIFSDAFRKILSNEDKTLIYIYNNNNTIPL
jgi:hypothetical protein